MPVCTWVKTFVVFCIAGQAFGSEVNVYSSRKDALIAPLLIRFSQQTGIDVNLITGKADALLSRIIAEGEATPADIFITVDAGRLHRAKEAGVLRTIDNPILNSKIPSHLRDIDGKWFGLTFRARPIFYAKGRVSPSDLSTYEALAETKWRQRVCVRSSASIYNQSLVASMIEANGEKKTLDWAKGLVENLARKPTGGDTDQLRATAAGQCDVAIANTYYFGRLLDSPKEDNRVLASKLGVFWPNQSGRGTHVNVSGVGVTLHSKNSNEAIELIKFMISTESQTYYAEINHEYPVIAGTPLSETISSLGDFKSDVLNLSTLGANNTAAVKLMDRAGWQ